jgi:hypothetical protein
MAYKPSEAKAVSTNFQGFLWTAITKIEQYEDEGDYAAALNKACRLIKYLPVNVKKKMEQDVEQITTFMNNIFQTKGGDFYTSMLGRNHQLTNDASALLKQFMNKLMMLLDERGIYMEYKRKEVPTGFQFGLGPESEVQPTPSTLQE